MIYTPLTKKAMMIAYNAHQGQLDVAGSPYIFHPFHLAEQMQTEEQTATALLHDVVEDTGVTFDQLRTQGIPETVLEAVRLLTHAEGVEYMDYVAALKHNPIAKTVKLADLAHNSDLTRLDSVNEQDMQRIEKYRKAKELLES
jgi:(p)ppGpp synthase/HD superfamily hydrolase